jgi:hypothetical protein
MHDDEHEDNRRARSKSRILQQARPEPQEAQNCRILGEDDQRLIKTRKREEEADESNE